MVENNKVKLIWAKKCQSFHDGLFNWIRFGREKGTSPQNVINQYNLVLITERFDESLIVLKSMLDLTFEDIMYVSVKY